jgi:hypothetical protein
MPGIWQGGIHLPINFPLHTLDQSTTLFLWIFWKKYPLPRPVYPETYLQFDIIFTFYPRKIAYLMTPGKAFETPIIQPICPNL